MTCTTTTMADNGVSLERARFFARQLVTPDDLMQDQRYFRDRLRRHNRLMHGWGVVCGLRVKSKEAWTVVVESGYALGPQGDEIVVPEPRTIDIRNETIGGDAVGCSDGGDPWCAEVPVQRAAGTWYLAIRYDECATRPVRHAHIGCGCDGEHCDYSRFRDGYALKVLPALPASHKDPMNPPELSVAWDCTRDENCTGRSCPSCPSEHWVVIADLTVQPDGAIKANCFAHRRYVVSFADYFFMCKPRRQFVPGVLVPGVLTTVGGIGTPSVHAVMRIDGAAVTLPGSVPVIAGSTLGETLARHGDTTFEDPLTGNRWTLNEIVDATGVDRNTPLTDTASLMALLEDRDAPVSVMNAVRPRVEEHLMPAGIDRLREAGTLGAVIHLPASDLAESDGFEKLLGQATVKDVASMKREDFMEEIVHSDDPEAAILRRKAGRLWDAAHTLAGVAGRFSERS